MKKLMMAAVAALGMSAFADMDMYNDLGNLRPEGGSNEFWDTSNHASFLIYTSSSSAIAVDTNGGPIEPSEAATKLSFFDSIWCSVSTSTECVITTLSRGFMFLAR